MPALIAHQLHATDIYNHLDYKAKNKANLDYFKVFAQSHDFLFYYHSFNMKETKHMNDLGKYFHKSNTQTYLINIVRNIIKNNLVNDKIAIAYLYGAIAHYTLDTICHPFIFYKTGVYSKSDPNTFKYYGMHNNMEKHIDAYLYEKHYNKKINAIKINKEIIPKLSFNNNIIELINLSYKDTYNKDDIGNYFVKGISNARNTLRFLGQDITGIKKILYKGISKLIFHSSIILSNYSYHIKKINTNYLNLNNSIWYHPCTKEEHHESFNDLFNLATNRAVEIINEVNKVLYEGKDYKELVKVIPNLSYTTGLLIQKNKSFKYFEY